MVCPADSVEPAGLNVPGGLLAGCTHKALGPPEPVRWRPEALIG